MPVQSMMMCKDVSNVFGFDSCFELRRKRVGDGERGRGAGEIYHKAGVYCRYQQLLAISPLSEPLWVARMTIRLGVVWEGGVRG